MNNNFIVLRETLRFYGEKEISGPRSNMIILNWIKKYFSWAKDDEEVPWCSIFLMNVLSPFFEIKEATGMARSWLKVGESVHWTNIEPGDIVVTRRGSSPTSGHVGVFVRFDHENKKVWLLGGNQSDSVNIARFNSSSILGIRRLKRKQ